MSFLWPKMLVFLIFAPVLTGVYISLQRRRQRIAASFGSFMGGQVHSRQPGKLRHIPAVLFLVGLTLLLFVLARPQMTVSLPRYEGTVILAFDVSGSMAAEDLEPNRMAAAKATASEFVNRLPSSVQIGIVAFRDSGLTVLNPTNDAEVILDSLERLEPQQGTSLGYGILTALNTILGESEEPIEGSQPAPTPVAENTDQSAAIILLTDGENTAPPDPFEAAFTAAQHGVRIYTIGIGSPAGTTLNINGYTVHTQLNETALEQIAGLSGGAYYNAESQEDLRQIYEKLSPELVIKPEKTEVTSIFAGASALFLLLGGGLMLVWFGRLP
jgi:Ca-activated chloride channel family protein